MLVSLQNKALSLGHTREYDWENEGLTKEDASMKIDAYRDLIFWLKVKKDLLRYRGYTIIIEISFYNLIFAL